jgi:hypothetical protein
MKNRNEMEMIKRLIGEGAHVAPSVEILKSELRSDSGLEPPISPPKSSLVYVIIKWKYHISLSNLDKFHAFLKENEEQIIADVKDLKLGAAYLGTYAELPGCRLHQTFWSYESLAAIDEFKAVLADKKKTSVYKGIKALVSYIGDPVMGMHRLVRASALAGQVAKQSKADPILEMFASNN